MNHQLSINLGIYNIFKQTHKYTYIICIYYIAIESHYIDSLYMFVY
jgi:hypothetical protein